jgi:UDP-3-O-[3-hydroxymyristoyl] glucosamine N-acyltransferase
MTENNKTVSELAVVVGGTVDGDGGIIIRRVASLTSAKAGEISFVEDLKLLEEVRASLASCLLVPNDFPQLDGTCLIRVARPKLAFALVAEILYPPNRSDASVHPSAVVATDAELGEGVFVDAHVRIGDNSKIGAGTQVFHGASVGDDVTIGRDCVIHPNVVLYRGVLLGDRVILHANVVIGADGFGYVPDQKNSLHKFPQIGTVVIGDDVEIGAGSCVDRGALGETRIGRGTKIDNLVQIAHNVKIGERVVIAAQTGISGSTVIEDDAIIGGQVGMGDHAHVKSGAIIGSKAGILPGKIVRKGVWWGIPVQPLEDYKRLNAHMNRLPQLREEVKELRRRVKELEEERSDDK